MIDKKRLLFSAICALILSMNACLENTTPPVVKQEVSVRTYSETKTGAQGESQQTGQTQPAQPGQAVQPVTGTQVQPQPYVPNVYYPNSGTHVYDSPYASYPH